jgi:hypothetical protein
VTKEYTASEGSPVAEGSSIPFTLTCAANMVTFPDILEDHSRYMPGSMCNSRSNSRRSSLRLKIDVISELRIMEEEMRKQEEMMKQAVAHHMSQSRSLSYDLPPIETSSERLETSTIRLNKVADLGLKVLQLEQSELSSIESQSNTVGHGEHLLSLLNNYEDKELSSVLQSLPGNPIFLFPSRLYFELHFILVASNLHNIDVEN